MLGHAWDRALVLGIQQQAWGRSGPFALPADPNPGFQLGVLIPEKALLDSGMWERVSEVIQDRATQWTWARAFSTSC